MAIPPRHGKRSSPWVELRYEAFEIISWCRDPACALGVVPVERAGDFVGARHRFAARAFQRGNANVEGRSSGVFGSGSGFESDDETRLAQPQGAAEQRSDVRCPHYG